MLDNKGKKIIVNKNIENKKEMTEAFEEKSKQKEQKLINYLINKKGSNGLDETDYLLFKYMDEEMKGRVSKKSGII